MGNFENPKNIKDIFQGAREKLDKRLQELNNPYHNRQHAEGVRHNLIVLLNNLSDDVSLSDREKIILEECALRHDDGHSGNTFRQDVAHDGLSNEEYAVKLLEEDFRGQIGEQDFQFMQDHILATSFGQSDKTKLPKGKKHYYREYKLKTASQRLLALADVSDFTKGWDIWMNNGLCLLQEAPQNIPNNIDAWIADRKDFVKFYISPLLESVKHLLRSKYFNELQDKLVVIITNIDSLKDRANPNRQIYSAQLQKIRERIQK